MVGLCLLQSCDNFLEYKDNDKVIPDKLEHFEELIYGELIRKNSDNVCYNLDVMTDDVASEVPSGNNASDDNREELFKWFAWAREPQIDQYGKEYNDKAWEFFYHKIVLCNTIENEMSLLANDLKGKKQRLTGEVQAIRAMCYFYLVNCYGAPLNKSDDTYRHLGVPINRETGIYNKLYVRSTLEEVYTEMESDLKKAIRNFEQGEKKRSIFRPNIDVARLFLSRVYLFQNRFEETIAVCDEFLERSESSIETIESLSKIDHNNRFLFSKASKSLIFSWWQRSSPPFSSWGARYMASPSLMELYQDGDIRATAYFEGLKPSKINQYSSNDCYGMCYRIEEAYFNRAEAYLGTDHKDKALDDLNYIRRNRLKNGYTALTANSVEEAWKLFKEEKRREFVAETMRWFDIRRWNESVTHIYPDFNNNTITKTFVLEAGSVNYILPLPLDIQRRNSKIEQVERIDIAAQ